MASDALHGFVLGFVIALTPGPMFFVCLRRTVDSGWRAGLRTGLGIATADGVYATLAAGGIGAAAAFVAGAERWLTLAGGLALVVLGLRTLLPAWRRGDGEAAGGVRAGPYASALGLTLTNPATILSFGAIFATVGVRSRLTVVATAAGSLTWWVALVLAASRLRGALGARAPLLSGLSGLALVAFGVVAVGRGLLR